MDYVPSLGKLKRLRGRAAFLRESNSCEKLLITLSNLVLAPPTVRESQENLDVLPDPPTYQSTLKALISPLFEFLDIGE